MNRTRYGTKSIGLLIAVSIFSASFFYQPAKVRAIGVSIGLDSADILAVPVKSYTEAAAKFAHVGVSAFGIPVPFTSLDSIMKLSVKGIIENLQKQIVQWVSVGNNGNPFFETNLGLYMSEVRNQAGAEYLSSNQGQLCGYFRDSLTTSLTLNFNISDSAGFSGFASLNGGSTCTLENSVGQGQLDAYFAGDFVGGGGWDTWTLLTQNDNNNPIGAYLVNRDRMNTAIQEKQAQELEELRWNNGVHSIKNTEGNVTTPGFVIAGQLNYTLSSDLRQLEGVKTFDDIVTVLTGTLVSKTINNAQGLLGANLNLSASYSSDSGDSGGSDSSGGGRYLRPDYESATRSSTAGTQAASEPRNISTQGKATQSTTGTSGDFVHEASLALYGSNNRDEQYGVAITHEAERQWWQVEFSESKPVTKIVLVPPRDDDYALTNFYVYISNTPIPGKTIPEPGPGMWRSELVTSTIPEAIHTVTPPKGTEGRYVRIARTDTARVKLAGVEVYSLSKPVITLLGANPMTISLNSQFRDPGASAIDENDGVISSRIVVKGAVDTTVAGTYTLTYTVKNSIGIQATAAKRIVVVE